MSRIWIGDFYCKPLQFLYDTEGQQEYDHQYIIEDLASYKWLATSGFQQIEKLSPAKSDIIIMLGFWDCVESCTWSSIKIDKVASDYAQSINKLIESYSDSNFYICSVNPVDGDYASSLAPNGVISAESLNAKIKSFNNNIKITCKATFIDSYNYLVKTNFITYDGIHYTQETSRALQSFIISNLAEEAGSLFVPRLTAPVVEASDDSADPVDDFWIHTSQGGENPFPLVNSTNGSTLPNCTAYAWGRFYEILGSAPTLSRSNAEYWYLKDGQHGYGDDGYKRGSTPALGAVICWQKGPIGGEGAGHVAIVEQINEDGSIVTSESGWESVNNWWLRTRTNSNGNWGAGSDYTFQGFIYCPQTSAAIKEDICTKNSYSITIDEMKPNAQYIWQYLGTRGWTINAVAGLLGNLQQESKMSPAIWESIISGSTINADGTQTLNMSAINTYYNNKGRYPGFGLVQWTPYYKYTDWCKTQNLPYWDIDSQLQRIEYEAEHKIQWYARPTKGYDLTFSEFITSTKSAFWLAGAFAFCYERPGRSSGTAAEQDALRKERGDNGEFWYNYLKNLPPITLDTQLRIAGFKVDKCEPDNISASFIARNVAAGKYALSKESKVITSEPIKLTDGAVTFDIEKQLEPATKYKLKLEVLGANEKRLSKEISFATPQDYPESVKTIMLTTSEKEPKSADSLFTLSITAPEYLGYWEDTSGYDIQLIVNNKCVKTLTSKVADIYWRNISIKEKFGYTCKTGDTVQVGVRVWVKDNKGNKLYDSSAAKTSNPICLLNQPVQPYLNINKID